MTDRSNNLLLGPESTPVLAADAVLSTAPGGLIVETPDEEVTIIGDRVDTLHELLRDFDGRSNLAEIARHHQLDETCLIAALEPLADSGALIDVAAPANASGDAEFLDTILLECRMRTRALFQQPFWRTVRSGSATKSEILGWGVEFAHFVGAANVYMPLGIAHCRAGSVVRETFSRHYVQEALHSEFFLAGLEACGLDRQQMEDAPPLASTRQLINLLSEYAIMGAAPFAACFAVMQPSQEPADARQLRAFYDELRDSYPFAAPMFDAFESHAMVDVELAHEVTLLERLSRTTGIAGPDRDRVIEVVHSLVEAFALFFEGILDAYGATGAPLPRRQVIARLAE